MINVTKTYLPPFGEYTDILKRAWDKSWITNNGELVQELEKKLKEQLCVNHLLFTSNGTVVLQIALKALNITKEVITTPFSYVATTNAILWEGCQPVFVDIEPTACCIDVSKIEAAITERTEAILVTHVYGFPCDVDKIEVIAVKHKLKVIYDGAHAFGAKYKGKSLLSFGDITTCSFHATKLFHTVEGGCIICNDDELARKLLLYRQFGHIGEDYYSMGINGKNSEFHAAMGLAVLPKISDIILKRKAVSELYDTLLNFNEINKPVIPAETVFNYGYYPVIFKSEQIVLRVLDALLQNNIAARRYFYPSLNQLPFLKEYQPCLISEATSKCVLTIPLFYDLSETDTRRIAAIINQQL
ncbi:DegT/DnrJ/EryC1/StrS family aminotransferase [Ferruginibacter paludis]|uniref:DegT/DnrJ/EryC1/StrS family aminotransferase n=1 Tax=Ferruginibacter paludis TaxID=1310417 RepID=UPI0025B2B4FF|nr:DegT/DnrJ/EryC1/StrS family aminotransferase [Ferruginibacter paludis]MDN3655879.1 DegT/DnrJ/EryC1/StrS family aminotransferase [Ferruginibacter paludis]